MTDYLTTPTTITNAITGQRVEIVVRRWSADERSAIVHALAAVSDARQHPDFKRSDRAENPQGWLGGLESLEAAVEQLAMALSPLFAPISRRHAIEWLSAPETEPFARFGLCSAKVQTLVAIHGAICDFNAIASLPGDSTKH
jgi:hypothetical protein